MEKHAQMNKLLNQIEWTEFPTTADFEGVAIINLFAEGDDSELESLTFPVTKSGDELVFVGPELTAQHATIRIEPVTFPDRSSTLHCGTLRCTSPRLRLATYERTGP
jgi:hypothetical protein